MDGQAQSISSQQLYEHLGTASAPVLVDVRRQDAFGTDDRLIIGALYRPLEEVELWLREFSANRPRIAIMGARSDAPLYTWCRQKVMQHSNPRARA